MSLVSDSENDDKIIRMPDLEYTPDPRGLGYALYTSMQKYSNNIAQIDGATGESDTYHTLLQKCRRVALKLQAMGVTNEDIVTSCSVNHINASVPYLATLFLGAKASALDPSLCATEAAHLLRQVEPKVMFVGPESLTLVRESLALIECDSKVIVFGPDFDKLLAPIEGEEQFRPYEVKNLQETCIIFFSSGTTGLPKCICIHHYGIMCQLWNFRAAGFVEDVYFTFSSLYWASAACCLCSVALAGNTRLMVPKFDENVIWNAIQKYKATLLCAVPFHFMSLYKAKPQDVDTSSVVSVLLGGATLIESQLESIEEMFPSAQLFPGYGQTEMSFTVTVFKSNPRDCELRKRKPTSSGMGLPGIWYKVVDLDTNKILGPNQVGELRLKTKFHLTGYYKMDSSHLWDEDGWYKTGDVAYYDEDQCFYIVDRIKEFLKFRGLHVSPAWIENLLATHPQVASSLVIGLPHEVDETHLLALVVLKDPSALVTPEEIEKFVEERVDDRKRLRGGVKIVDSIPLSANGKTKRRDIRDMILRGEL